MKDNKAEIQKWAITWENARIALNTVKSIEMRKDNYLSSSLLALSEAFNYALAAAKPSTTSGLVEMQKHFAKLRRNDSSA